MSFHLPAIAPQPEPTLQERNAALFMNVISAIMTPPKGQRVENPDIDRMMRGMRAQRFINDLARMQPEDDARWAKAVRTYRAIGAIGEAAGGLPFDQMRRSENIEDLRGRPFVPTLENATVIEDLFVVREEAEKRGESIPLRAIMKRMGEIQDAAIAQPEPPPMPAATDNPLAAAAGYNDIEALFARGRAVLSGRPP